MRGAALLALVLPCAAACATSREVWFDQREDFSRHRTWEWLPPPAQTVDAPDRARELEARLIRLVARALDERGLEFAPGRADLLVRYDLDVEREHVLVHETPAVEQLSSLHSSPSYEIQATRQVLHVYEHARLEIVVLADAQRRRPIWRGAIAGRYRGAFPLKQAVARLLEAFPPEPAEPSGRGAPVEGPSLPATGLP
jgi:hypothetical protein